MLIYTVFHSKSSKIEHINFWQHLYFLKHSFKLNSYRKVFFVLLISIYNRNLRKWDGYYKKVVFLIWSLVIVLLLNSKFQSIKCLTSYFSSRCFICSITQLRIPITVKLFSHNVVWKIFRRNIYLLILYLRVSDFVHSSSAHAACLIFESDGLMHPVGEGYVCPGENELWSFSVPLDVSVIILSTSLFVYIQSRFCPIWL